MNPTIDAITLKQALTPYAKELSFTLPQEEDCFALEVSPRFERRMKRMLRDHQKFYYFWFNTLGKQVASIVILIVLGLTVTTFSVKAWREPVVQFVIEFFEKFASFTVKQNPQIPAELIATEPTYIPDGFFKVSTTKNDFQNIILYRNSNGEEFFFKQQCLSATTGGVDTENATFRPIIINEREGIISLKDDHGVIKFSTDRYLFTVVFTVVDILTEEDLINIAESIPLE